MKRVFDLLADLSGKPKPKWKVPYAVAIAAAYVSELMADMVTGVSPAATITGVKLAPESDEVRRHREFEG